MAKFVVKKVVRFVKKLFNKTTFRDEMAEKYEEIVEGENDEFNGVPYHVSPAGKAFMEGLVIPKFQEEFKRKPNSLIRIIFEKKDGYCFYRISNGDESQPEKKSPYNFEIAEVARKIAEKYYGIQANYCDDLDHNRIHFDLNLA